MCKQKIIASWESACKDCWEKLTEQEREWIVMLNHIREILRECGVDLTELHKLW